MIVRSVEDVRGTEHEVDTPTWSSRRILTKQDGTSFSLHDTMIKAGTESYFWYKYHVEAVYCIEGEGEVEEKDTGKVHPIKAGTLYCLNGHEKHFLRAKTDMRMICVFDPPCSGKEVHDEEGIYQLG